MPSPRPLSAAFLAVAFLLLAAAASAGRLRDVRAAQHPGFTRLVFELDAPAMYRITDRSRSAREVRVDLLGGVDGETLPLRFGDGSHILSMARGAEGEFRFAVGGPVEVADALLDNPPRIVFDFFPAGTRPAGLVTATESVPVPPLAAAADSADPTPAPPTSVRASRERPSGPKRRLIVVIDPGHGGHHKGGGGRIGSRQLWEKEIVLPIAFMIEDILKKDGRYDVRLTRRDDRYIGLFERTQIAEGFQGDLFVSLHCNAIEGNASRRAKARGIEFWIWSPQSSGTAASKALEKLENTEPEGTLSPARSILNQMMTDALVSQSLESKNLAQAMERAFLRDADIKRHYRGIDSARFKVLENYSMPSVLIEYGFMTHPDEVKQLADSAYQRRMARHTVDAIIAYLQDRERRELAQTADSGR
ncbi:MAG: N-acetylmuramoyl-L-alanine amidase [Candidatus Sumerlaeia bacterium]|nr:N-acetylmuramoyl-L-alanine amidase [Candidatus Sumerlaeia bacterium]